ncbi:transcriptional coactivator/pterin dehydratase [Aspergillus californicus]
MNSAFKGYQRLQVSLFRLNPWCSRHFSSHQLPVPFQSQNPRKPTFSVVHPYIHSRGEIAFRRASTMTSEPHFAEGIDPEQMRLLLNKLEGEGWSLDEDKIGIKKTFYFRAYFKATSFVNVIASQSAAKKHHATMTFRFGSVDVHWTTHHPHGLTDKDISMAQFCDQAAELVGAVPEGQGQKCGPST